MESEADKLLGRIERLDNLFTPENAVELLRGTYDTPDAHILADLIEGLWDEVQRLRCVLDQSKGERK